MAGILFALTLSFTSCGFQIGDSFVCEGNDDGRGNGLVKANVENIITTFREYGGTCTKK